MTRIRRSSPRRGNPEPNSNRRQRALVIIAGLLVAFTLLRLALGAPATDLLIPAAAFVIVLILYLIS